MVLQKKIDIDHFQKILKNLDLEKVKILKKAYELKEKKEEFYLLKPEILNDSKKYDQISELLSKSTIENDNIKKTNYKINNNNNMEKFEKEIEILKKEKYVLENKFNDYENILKRRQAEFENYRKRTLKEKEILQFKSNKKFIENLLPIIDSLEKAIELSSKQSEILQFRDGVILIEKQLKQMLFQNGVTIIEALGKEFDPSKHEALQIDESHTNYKVSTVISEWQKGYMLGKQIIRHSKVVVAKVNENISEVLKKDKFLLNNKIMKNSDSNNRNFEKINFIPENYFQNSIIKKIKSDDDKKLIEKIYSKIEGNYTIKEEYQKNDNLLNSILNIFKSIGFLEK